MSSIFGKSSWLGRAVFLSGAGAALAAECSESCAAEFINGCLRHHVRTGKTTQAAFDQCVQEINDERPQLAAQGCVPQCEPTTAMLEATGSDDGDSGGDGGSGGTSEGSCQAGSYPRKVASPPGGTISELYGTVVLVGDSAFDGCGTTGGMVESTLATLLDTKVINNAKGGASLKNIFNEQPACSETPDCKWSVIIAGMNPGDGSVSMQDFVDRELAAGKKVIIQGHPDPNKEAKFSAWNAFMDSYKPIADASPNVWFVDARDNPIWRSGSEYYAGDNSHPSREGGKVFASNVRDIIAAASGEDDNGDGQGESPDEGGGQDQTEGDGDDQSQDGSEDGAIAGSSRAVPLAALGSFAVAAVCATGA